MNIASGRIGGFQPDSGMAGAVSSPSIERMADSIAAQACSAAEIMKSIEARLEFLCNGGSPDDGITSEPDAVGYPMVAGATSALAQADDALVTIKRSAASIAQLVERYSMQVGRL